MAGGIWSDPIDVGVEGVPTTLLTAIADNLRCLYKGNGSEEITSIAANGDNELDIGVTDDIFLISSVVNNINTISTTERQPRNRIVLINNVNDELYFGTGATPNAGYAAVRHRGAPGSTLNILGYECITLYYTGSYWQLGVTVNV